MIEPLRRARLIYRGAMRRPAGVQIVRAVNFHGRKKLLLQFSAAHFWLMCPSAFVA